MKTSPSNGAKLVRESRFAASGRAIVSAVGFDPALSSEVSGWNNLALFGWNGYCRQAQFEPFAEPVIVYHVGGAQSVNVRVGRRSAQRTHPGLITIIPPATRVGWDIGGEVHSRSLHLSSRFFDGVADYTKPAHPELPFRCGVQDPLIAAVMGTLEREVRAPSQTGSLYADSVADTLALHLISTHAADTRPTAFQGGLSNRLLRRSLERLEASIVGGVSLQELADEAELSRTYFADAFRRATGVAPHRYLTERRLERARELLRNTAKPISEVALQCGFSSQAHLSTSFRASYGLSPRRFRVDSDS